MIKEKTVLILGAGASKPFGFPIGFELLHLVYQALEYKPVKEFKKFDTPGFSLMGKHIDGEEVDVKDDTRSSNKLFQLLIDCGFTKKEIEKFRHDLFKSNIRSVDAFLEYRPEFIELGKLAIGYTLLQYENKDAFDDHNNCYEYIFNKMLSPFDQFHQNKISFITFNYDRSLEYFLMSSLESLYGKNIVECYEILKQIPIIHLHGKLGDLPWECKESSVEYGHNVKEIDIFQQIGSSIKIIHEKTDYDVEFNQAFKVMREAKSIGIMGLGYSQTNIDRLGIKFLNTKIKGTSYGVPNMERRSIMKKNPNIILEESINRDRDCLEFLQEIFEIN